MCSGRGSRWWNTQKTEDFITNIFKPAEVTGIEHGEMTAGERVRPAEERPWYCDRQGRLQY